MRIALGIVGVIVVVLAADSAGNLFRRLILKQKQRFSDSGLDELVSIALGLIFISYLLFFLVSMNWISQNILWFFLLFCVFLAAPRFHVLFRLAVSSIGKLNVRRDIWIIFLILYFVFMIALTTLPSSVRDELIYHLEIPKRLIESGGEVTFTNNIYAYFPRLADMFFLLGLGTAGEATAKLSHVLSGFLLMIVIYRVALNWLGKKYAILSVGVFLSIPSVMVIMPWAYIDLTYTLYAVLAFLMLFEYTKRRDLGWIILAGVFFGVTICIKYTGLQLTALGICFVVYAKLKDRNLVLFTPLILLGIIPLVLAFPYFIRNWAVTGWPLFPFEVPGFYLKLGFNWDPTRAKLYLTWLQTFGTPFGIGALQSMMLAPLFVFVLGQFNKPQFYEGMLGPVFLLIPFLLFRKKLRPEVKQVVFFSLLFIFYWAVTTKQVRFLLPVMPFLSILLAYGLQSHKKKWLIVLVCVLIMMNAAVGLNEIIKRGPFGYWSSKMSREEYLGKHNRVYPVYAMANKLLRAGDKIYLVHMKNYGYYLDHPWEGDFVFERYRIENLLNRNPSIQEISDYFDHLGITHLILNHAPIMNEVTGLEEDQQRLIARFLSEKSVLVFRHETYGIYLLK